MEPLAPEIWSQKASVLWHRYAVDSRKIVKDCALSRCCLFLNNMTFFWCVCDVSPASCVLLIMCVTLCTKALCAYWVELMLIDFDRVWGIEDCVCVSVLTSVLGVVCVCNLAMSCCFSSGGWSFLVSLGNVLSLSLSLSLSVRDNKKWLFPSKPGQDMEFSPY